MIRFVMDIFSGFRAPRKKMEEKNKKNEKKRYFFSEVKKKMPTDNQMKRDMKTTTGNVWNA